MKNAIKNEVIADLRETVKRLETDAALMRVGKTSRNLADTGRDIHTVTDALLERLEDAK